MSIKYCLPVSVFYFWQKLQRTLQRGLSAIAEHLVNNLLSIHIHKCGEKFMQCGKNDAVQGMFQRLPNTIAPVVTVIADM